jgi:hypothetical protein
VKFWEKFGFMNNGKWVEMGPAGAVRRCGGGAEVAWCNGNGWVVVYGGVGLVFGRSENRDGVGEVYGAGEK